MKENKFDTVKNAGNKNSIEEDIKNIEEIIELSKEEIDAKAEDIIAILDIEDLISLEHILSSYKKALKENEELKSNNEKYTIHLTDKQYNAVIENAQNDINQKWIRKVKDKVEKEIKYHEKNILDIENITMLKSKTAKEEAEIEFNKYAIVVLNKILQELIKESGGKKYVRILHKKYK